MLNKVNNSQPAFGMSMHKIPEKYQREFAEIVGANTRLTKKGLDKYIKRASKNPHFDILFKPSDNIEKTIKDPAAMFVLNHKNGDKLFEYKNTGKSYLQKSLEYYSQNAEGSNFFIKLLNSVAAQKEKIQAKIFNQEYLMPEFMVKALKSAERAGIKEQKILDMVEETNKIFEKNSDLLIK